MATVRWVDVPGVSAYVQSWLQPWQQCWQQPGTCVHTAMIGRQTGAELRGGLAASDRDVPLVAGLVHPGGSGRGSRDIMGW